MPHSGTERRLGIEDPAVVDEYSLEYGKLLYRTDVLRLSHEARHAMAAGRNLSVCLASEAKEVTGKVLSVTQVDGVDPAQWEIVIRLSA